MYKKLPLCFALTASAFFIVACGDDDKPSKQDKLDAACGRSVRVYGAKDCSGLGGAATGDSGGGGTSTVTVTATATN